ncbi:N-acetylglucosaminidase [Clostridium ihumii]|uniref:N-acetylglucosaminidase n=1 Tax=Clostridium ihumii TaxID=1470356 RepID=UPI000688A853|nr:glucosaminidase domain-containing protein [Clostridium ihumii]
MNKRKKSYALLFCMIIMFTGFIFTSRVSAATDPKVFEHKENIPLNKVWSIYLNDSLNQTTINNLSNYVKVTNARAQVQAVNVNYDATNKVINVNPPQEGYKPNTIYSLVVSKSISNSIQSNLENNYVIDFTTAKTSTSINVPSGSNVKYRDYNFTLEQFVQTQSERKPMFNRLNPFTSSASLANVKAFADAESLSYDSTQIYQFLSLKYIDGISVDALNRHINYKGIIKDKGNVFIEAGKKYNINPIYLNAHCALETGYGTSQLANGVDYKTPDGKIVKVYNMYGIGAIDSDPLNGGAKYAYEQGWTTPDKAIIGGAEWIGKGYIHASKDGKFEDKDTLYKMRWAINEYPNGWKQYATDIAWAYKQAFNFKTIIDESPNAKLIFEIPRFIK